ncbi:MAG TPA: hypothetical protein VIJ66_04320 [Solirubrobacteraceae bacterium]
MNSADQTTILNAADAPPEPLLDTEATGTLPRPTIRPETADSRLLNRVSALRDRTRDLDDEVRVLHQDTRELELDERTTAAAMRDPYDLLRELSHRYGLSWAAIARLAAVSSTAVRKWRRGETISPDKRRAIARAVTFLQMLSDNAGPLEDVGSWLEMPLSDQATLTPLDLYALGNVALLLDHVAGHLGAHAMLDAFDDRWRERYARDQTFVVEDAGDGHLSIVERSR